MVGGAVGDLGLVSAKGWGDELSIRVILLFAVPGVTANGRITRMVGGAAGADSGNRRVFLESGGVSL